MLSKEMIENCSAFFVDSLHFINVLGNFLHSHKSIVLEIREEEMRFLPTENHGRHQSVFKKLHLISSSCIFKWATLSFHTCLEGKLSRGRVYQNPRITPPPPLKQACTVCYADVMLDTQRCAYRPSFNHPPLSGLPPSMYVPYQLLLLVRAGDGESLELLQEQGIFEDSLDRLDQEGLQRCRLLLPRVERLQEFLQSGVAFVWTKNKVWFKFQNIQRLMLLIRYAMKIWWNLHRKRQKVEKFGRKSCKSSRLSLKIRFCI